jgi:putative peptidoglycan lipid II flippase
VAVLYHYGAFTDHDVTPGVATALMGYGAGLIGLVAIKVLAPRLLRRARTSARPVRIAVVVLVVTQLLNIAFVPLLQHAGLALSIGVGALINAAWLLAGLHRRGSWRPQPGWGVFLLAGGGSQRLARRVPDVGGRSICLDSHA